jgi:transcriptional regulator with XRE-family HTH domain
MADKIKNEFSDWLIRRMGTLGLKNSDVAEAAGVSSPAVSLWRTAVNVPDNERIGVLAEVLQVTPETLLIKLGRMQPRPGVTAEWDQVITRVQDSGTDAERLIFSVGDALLAALSQKPTGMRVTLSLDVLWDKDEALVPDEGERVLLYFGSITLPGGAPTTLKVTCYATDEEAYTIEVTHPENDLSGYDWVLQVGSEDYLPTHIGGGMSFEGVPLKPYIGTLRLSVS